MASSSRPSHLQSSHLRHVSNGGLVIDQDATIDKAQPDVIAGSFSTRQQEQTPIQRVFAVSVHDESFSKEDIILNASGDDNIPMGELLRLVPLKGTGAFHHGKVSDEDLDWGKQFVFVSKPVSQDLLSIQPDLQISIIRHVAQVFGFKKGASVVVSTTGEAGFHASHVEIIFRDQYLARADMWRLVSAELANTCIFRAQRVLYMGSIKATIKTIFVNGKKVPSAFFHSSTKPIFRSESARYVLCIQMSREMWDFDAEGSGELMFDKVINGFLPELFKRWRELKVKHLVSIVLFTRMIYDQRKHADSATSGLDAIEPHYRDPGTATTPKDFYRVVVSDTASGEWASILSQLRKEFLVFLRDISIRPPDAGSHLPCGPDSSSTLADTLSHVIAGHPSAATRGNILEAINLASSQFSSDYVDRDLVRTGVSIVVISPSAGLFEVDYRLLVATTENLIENGVGIDLVCLSRMPLHSAPLFMYQIPPFGFKDAPKTVTRNKMTDEETPKGSFSVSLGIGAPLGFSNNNERPLKDARNRTGTKGWAWSYGIPHWVDISFWTPESDNSSKQATLPENPRHKSTFDVPQHKAFVSRVRMYELQMMGVMGNAISDISIEPLSKTFQSPLTFSQRLRTNNVETSSRNNLTYPVYGSLRSSHTESPGRTPTLSGSPSSRHPSRNSTARPLLEWMDEYDDLVYRHPHIARKRAGKTKPSNDHFKTQQQQEHSPPSPSSSASTPYISLSHTKRSSDKESFLTQVMIERRASQKKTANKGGLVGHFPRLLTASPKKNLASHQISFGPRGFGASAAKALASTEVSTDHGAASLSTLGLKTRFSVKDAGRASDISTQAEQKKCDSLDLRRANASAEPAFPSGAESQQASRPIPIRKGTAIRIREGDKSARQPQRQEKHEEAAGMESYGRLTALKDVRQVEYSAPDLEAEDIDDAQPLPTILSSSTTLVPWLTILNPSNPSKDTNCLASRLGRWHHVFPRPLRTSQMKWKSLCSPAAVPLTTEEFPSAEELSDKYQQSVYHVEVPENRELSETSRSLITELITFRLSRGFQIVVGTRLAESVTLPSTLPQPFNIFDEQVLTDRAIIFLSRGSTIHQIEKKDEYKVEIKQYIRCNVVTAQNADVDSVLYQPFIRSMLTVHYETQIISIAPPRIDFDWKTIDHVIVGHEKPKAEDFVEKLRPWRARFVLIPVETPTNTRRPLNSINEDDEEEIRLEGIRKLTQVWQRFRYVPPEERRFQAPLRNRKDTNPLDIMYQTRNPSAIVAAELENVAEGDAAGKPVQLLPESELYQRSTFKISALAETMQSEKGVRMLDRRWHWRLHYNCFIGLELTTWLLQNFRDVDTRDEAVELGNDLMKSGLFRHVQQRHDFRDGNYFYQVADEYRTPRLESRGWFGRAKASVPSTPLSDDVAKDSTSISHSRAGSNNASSAGDASEPTTPTGKTQKLGVALSKSLLYDVDHRKRSYRPETINLHYDRLHNPDNCYHIRIEWMNTTAKLIQDAVTSWATSVDRFGLRLVEVPIGEASSITSMHPFRAPYRVRLQQQPPTKQPKSYFDNTSFSPQPKTQKHYYQKALLKRFEFVLDFEAASDFPRDVSVTYSWGKPDYKLPQYIHRSGKLVAQITDEGDFLLLANRLYNNRGASVNLDYKGGHRTDDMSDTDSHHGPGFFRSIPQRSGLSNLGGSPRSSPISSPSVRAALDSPAYTTHSIRGPSTASRISQYTDATSARASSASATAEAVKQAFEDFCNNKQLLDKFYEEVLSKASTPGPNTPLLGSKTPSKGPMTPSREAEKLAFESSIPSLALPERLVGKRKSMDIGHGKGDRAEKKPDMKAGLVGESPDTYGADTG
ncbi:hypothetical protein N7G274_007404 [Stereocaulon virgatum]|uniref:Vacuolar membrane-associated protein IML1 n=1 Tax=Stereocaulon virgatum TaxID=373712 RepID=A0ABR4A3U1_9LECA